AESLPLGKNHTSRRVGGVVPFGGQNGERGDNRMIVNGGGGKDGVIGFNRPQVRFQQRTVEDWMDFGVCW
ncbi:hypothetical protein A2U01_0065153, partial [Trifolium medium]|nr:hypothetical protein [Trifolium medium]